MARVECTSEISFDDFGFPTDTHSRRQNRRIRIRSFTTRNHWESRYATIASVLEGLTSRDGFLAIESLVVNHGILPEYRAALYWTLCEQNRKLSTCGSTAETYQQLLANSSGMDADIAKQIELDIPRTFCDQREFVAAASERSNEGHDGSRSAIMEHCTSDAVLGTIQVPGSGNIQDALRRLLRAFCMAHPDQGYLQSMNFVAAFMLLIFTPANEEKAFWCFEFLCAHILYGYYTPGMTKLLEDTDVFRKAVNARKPKTATHLMDVGCVDIASLFLPRWLLCGFLNCFPAEIVVRVWDCMILDGLQGARVLVEVALAVVEMCDENLRQCKSFADAAQSLCNIGCLVSDSAELMLLTRSASCSLRSYPMEEMRSSAFSPSKFLVCVRQSPGVISPSAVSGVKRKRHDLHEVVTGSPAKTAASMKSPRAALGSPDLRTPAAANRRTSILKASTPGRTPPVKFEGSLDRLDAVLAPFPALSPAHKATSSPALKSPLAMHPMQSPLPKASPSLKSPFGAAQSPKLRSPLLQSPVMVASRTAVRNAAPCTPAVPATPSGASFAVVGTPSSISVAIACALNPSTAMGAASARKRRALMRQAHESGNRSVTSIGSTRKLGRPENVPGGSATGSKTHPAPRAYSTLYSEYDDEAEDIAESHRSHQLMNLAPPSSKRLRAGTAPGDYDENAAPMTAMATKAGKSIQMQLMSPPRNARGDLFVGSRSTRQ